MPGPSIMVRVLADLTNLAKGFKDAGSKGKEVASSVQQGFGQMLAAVNKTGVLGPFGEALSGVNEAVGSLIEHAKSIGPALGIAGSAVAGIGVALSALGSKDQAAHQQLQAAVDATGKAYDGYDQQVESAIKKQEKFGNTANETQDALRVLTQATNDPAKAMGYLATASDLAAAKHESLTTAAQSMAQAYAGNTRALKEFGIQVTAQKNPQQALTNATNQATRADLAYRTAKQHLADILAAMHGKAPATLADQIKVRDATQKVTAAQGAAVQAHKNLATAEDTAKHGSKTMADAMTQLATKLHGQAAASADTFGGHIAAIKAHLEDVASAIGQKYGPALTTAGTLTAGLGGAMTTAQGVMKTFAKGQKDVEGATKAVAAAQDVEAASSWAALGPILLIIAAVVALIAVGYLIYRNWTTIWKAIKAVVADVWNWIKANWPLLLGILLGPIGLAAALIYRYWSQILSGIQAVWHWIRSAWGDVVGFLTAPIAAAIRWIAGAWGAVTGAISGVIGWIRSAWNGVYGALTGPISSAVSWITGVVSRIGGLFTALPGHIRTTVAGVYNAIIAPFQAALAFVKRLWNDTVGKLKLPSIPGAGVAKGLLSHIPGLQTGGYITSTGLVLAHAGETVVPAGHTPAATARAGPVVVIHNAHFVQETDIDLFMNRVAWLARTKAV